MLQILRDCRGRRIWECLSSYLFEVQVGKGNQSHKEVKFMSG